MHETFPKKGRHGGKSFDTESFPSGWNDTDPHRREYRKSGRHPKAKLAGDNYKVKPRRAKAGDSTRRHYPKHGNKAQNAFDTGR